MKYANLYNLLALRLASVVFNHGIEAYESDFEEGQRALLASVDVDETGTCPCLIFDATRFEDHNRTIAKPVYYDKDQNPTETSFEAGCYKPVDTLFINEDEDFLLIPDDPEVRAICDYVVANDMGHVPLAQLMLHLASLNLSKEVPLPIYGLEEKSETFEVGDVAILTESKHCPYTGKELPALSIVQIAGDSEEGFYLKTPDDKKLAKWNDSIGMRAFDDVFKPWRGMKQVNAASVLDDTKSRFCVDDPDINHAVRCDKDVRYLIYFCGSEGLDKMVNLAYRGVRDMPEKSKSRDKEI